MRGSSDLGFTLRINFGPIFFVLMDEMLCNLDGSFWFVCSGERFFDVANCWRCCFVLADILLELGVFFLIADSNVLFLFVFSLTVCFRIFSKKNPIETLSTILD